MNTILLPRVIALQCKLNSTLEHLGSISTSHPLYQATFVYTNSSQAVSSAHIVVVISKNVSAAQAESLLYDLTHNSTDARIGNNLNFSYLFKQSYLWNGVLSKKIELIMWHYVCLTNFSATFQ